MFEVFAAAPNLVAQMLLKTFQNRTLAEMLAEMQQVSWATFAPRQLQLFAHSKGPGLC